LANPVAHQALRSGVIDGSGHLRPAIGLPASGSTRFAVQWCRMERFLVGHSILVVEDAEALTEVENPNLSAAILDHGLVDGNSSQVCERLKARDVPFINYTGFGNVDGPCSAGLLVAKPANPQELVTLVIGLLRDRQVPPGTMAENV
jgi:hypothetical protein